MTACKVHYTTKFRIKDLETGKYYYTNSYKQKDSCISFTEYNRDGAGEDWSWFEVGEKGVIEIQENHPVDGMPLNYVVIVEDKIVRIFNPNYVEYE